MSGTRAGWSPERRAAQAERMRRINGDPDVMTKRAETLATSPKVRAARQRNARKMALDPECQAKSRAWRATPEGKASLAAAARRLNELRAVDGPIRDAWLSGQALSNASDAKRAAASRTLKLLHQRDDYRERQTILLKWIHGDPDVQARRVATRRAGKVPKGASKRYRALRDRIGPEEAMRIVQSEARGIEDRQKQGERMRVSGPHGKAAWTPHESGMLVEMKEGGKSWAEIVARLPGRSLGAIQARWTFLRGADPSTERFAAPSLRDVHSRDRALDRAREARASSTSGRDLTSLICGDPPPGRSALDRRTQATPDRTSITLAPAAM
jgi:hypothetical protein